MDFDVLGQLEARRDGAPVALGSFKHRALLSLLVVHANEVVSTDRIIDELWGDEGAGGRPNSLWVHISNLRSALEPDRAPRSEGTVLLTRAPGYVLQVGPDELDAWRFEQLVREGRSLLETDPAAASMAIGEGLALWRGRPYSDVTYESFAQPEIARLEELRLDAVELRIDADLRRGLSSELTGELESLVAQHPLRERLTALSMTALYRSGRQAEALRAYQRLRVRLGDELGIDPSAALRDLEGRIVVGDTTLDEHTATPGSTTRLAVRGYEIREPLGESSLGSAYRAYQPAVGREVTVKVIRPELADDPAFIRRFEAGAELVARLEHPHIVPVYDYWREPGAAYLVTRSMHGGNLTETVARGPLDPTRGAQLVREIGSALALAHRNGVTHRDVTPSNIVLDDDGRAYLTDFDLVDEPQGGTPADDIVGLGRVLDYALTGSTTERSTVSPQISRVIERATSAHPDEQFTDVMSFVDAVESAVGSAVVEVSPPETTGINPYKGLRAFTEADADNFFGRERLVERLVTRVGETGSRCRFIAVVGPSGSGKSSIVKAGLIPAVREGAVAESSDWFVVEMTPGRQPYEALEDALRHVATNAPWSLLDELMSGEAGIRRTVRRVLPGERAQLFLVIDQFEELFTQTDAATANSFLDALSAAADDPQSNLRLVITLRADFYDRPLRHRAMGELLRRGTELVTPMSPEQVERAITGPAEREGVHFEAGLVAAIVADVAEHPGSLPLLQYALTELFERRRGAVIELTSYREIGGLTGALARRAESLYAALDPGAKGAVRQALLRLVTLGDGADADVRRRVLRRDLTGLDPSVDHALETFGKHRLLTFDRDPATRGPTVEIAHEALLTEWDRLRGWIDASRDDIRRERRLGAAAAEWHAAGRPVDYLLSGSRLDELSGWAASTDLTLDPCEQKYLAASEARRDDERAAEHERVRRETQLAHSRRTRTLLLVASAVVLALVAGLATYAFVQRNEADRLAGQIASQSEARRLASAAVVLAAEQPDLAIRVALESLDSSARAGAPALLEAEEALHWALQSARVPYPDADWPVEVRAGPAGPTGIYRMPLDELVEMALGHVGPRALTTLECSRVHLTPCPTRTAASWPVIPTETHRPPLPDQAARPLAGTTITVAGDQDDHPGLRAELAAFESRTGIRVEFDRRYDARLDGRDLLLEHSADIDELARDGTAIDLGAFLDVDVVRRTFADRVADIATVDSGLFGVPVSLETKGLVFYPLDAFAAAGYVAPTTWAGLLHLSRQIVADGRTPWCLGLDEGGFSGMAGTDWVEALVLRAETPGFYERWTAGEVAFADPAIHDAFAAFGAIAFGEGFVRNGASGISTMSYFDAVGQLGTDPPGCWLNHNGSGQLGEVRRITGTDLGYFLVPPLEPGGPAPVFGSAMMAVAVQDRPEVREFVRGLLDPEWGSVWASTARDTFMSANPGFDPRKCHSPDLSSAANDVRVALCEVQRDAVTSGSWHLDASEHMSGNIGLFDLAGGRGGFRQALLDYVDGGPAVLDDVLAEVDALSD